MKAKKDDIVLILGKGAEEYMYRGEGREPWMGDVEAAKKSLKIVYRTNVDICNLSLSIFSHPSSY